MPGGTSRNIPGERFSCRLEMRLVGGSRSGGTSRGARSCSSDATASMRASPMPQRRAAPSSSTLARATMLMPWWCAMKVLTRATPSAPDWRPGE